MGPLEATEICLAKAIDFSGRASRSEFWWFVPMNLCLAFALIAAMPKEGVMQPELVAIAAIWTALCLPAWAALVRRLHDLGKRGRIVTIAAGILLACVAYFAVIRLCSMVNACWDTTFGDFLLLTALILAPLHPFILIIPIACVAYTMLIALKPSDPGPNKFGPNLHEVTP